MWESENQDESPLMTTDNFHGIDGLVGQCSIFVRNREQLANPPVSLALDGAAIERLTRLVSAWALAGLAAAA
jgi:hypothetical protein